MMDTAWAWSISMLAILGAWAGFTGMGLAVGSLFRLRTRALGRLLQASWVGWAVTIVFLQVWHGFFPVNAAARALCLLAAAAGIIGSRRAFGSAVAGRHCAAWLAAGVLLAVWVSNHALRQPDIYDSGLYHLNAVRWAEQYALVPGLANLHWRLGFNNSSHLYTALFDAGPLQNRSHQVASGVLIFMALLPALHGFFGVVGRRATGPTERYWAFLLAPTAVWAAVGGYASSPSPDVPVFLLAVVLGGRLVSLLDDHASASPRSAFLTIVLLSAVAVTVKLSIAVFAVLACLVAWLALWQKPGQTKRALVRVSVAGFLLGAAAIIPWMVRGVVLSGWPAFPIPLCGLPVDWAIPESTVRETALRIKAWARQPGVPPEQVLGNTAWFAGWLRQSLVLNVQTFTAPLAAAAAGAVLMVGQWRRQRHGPGLVEGMCYAVPAGGLVYWFSGAPDPRFLGSQLWVLAAMLLACSVQGRSKRVKQGVLLVEVVLLVFCMIDPVRLIWGWKDPAPAHRVEMLGKTTASGLTVLVPKHGDQVWNSDLPATPYFNPRLRLRVPGRMDKGFTKRPQETKRNQ